MNDNTVGIALIGNYENQAPDSLMMQSLTALLTWEVCNKGIGIVDQQFHLGSELELNRVAGHKDGNPSQIGCPSATLCPGDFVYTQLDTILAHIAATPCLIDSTKDVYYDLATNDAENIIFNPGEAVVLSALLRSYGNGFDSLAYSVGIYLSEDDSLEQSDVLIASDTFSYAIDSVGLPFMKEVTIPATIFPNEYYMIMQIDHLEQLIELDEANNEYAFQVNIAYPVGINEKFQSSSPLFFYPNPSRHRVYFSNHVISFELINSSGQVVQKGNNEEISIDGLSSGNYFLKLFTTKGLQIKKLVVVL